MGVKKASILSSCGTTPTASLDCFLYLSISKPHIHTFPEVFITVPEIILIKVPTEIYPELRRTFIFVFECSGFREIKIDEQVDFKKLYNLRNN